MDALFAYQIKDILKERGWTSVELAARWKISVTWMSHLVNSPSARPPMFDDAIRGLPPRSETTVQRQARHIRKPKPKKKFEMFPIGRIFQAENGQFIEPETEVYVVDVRSDGQEILVQIVDSDETFTLTATQMASHFADTTRSI